MKWTEIRVALVIKSRIYREGITAHFSNQSSIHLEGEFNDLPQFTAELARQSVDVIVLESDIEDFIEWVVKIKSSRQPAKIVTIVLGPSPDSIRQCIQAGVEGLVTSHDGIDDLCDCIFNVHCGRMSYPAELSRQVLHRPLAINTTPHERFELTSRQLKVMELLESGYSNKEIARTLDIQLATVKNHVHQILERLNVKSRCEAAALFRRRQTQLSST